MDAEARVREFIEGGATTEEVVRGLRVAGFSRMVSASALMKATGMGLSEVLKAVVGSPVWADQVSSLDDWIDPPEPPDAVTLDRLREVFRSEPRMAEVWIRGSRFIRSDGGLDERTDVVFVLDPPLIGSFEEESRFLVEFLNRLQECWPLPASGQRGYKPVTRDILEAHAEHCLEVFRREAPG
jgi:hypothetical protein